MLLVYNIP